MNAHHRPRLVAAAAAVAFLLAACGDDGDGAPTASEPAGPATAPSATAASPVASAPPTADSLPDDGAATATTSPATASPTSAAPGPLVDPAVGLLEIGSFDQPVEVATRPGDGRPFVVEQSGSIVVVTGEGTSEVALDITDLTSADGERGLLGLAFHPTDPLAYVHYSDANGDTTIAEFPVDPTSGAFDPARRREVLTVDQPFGNHNGGQIAFGPDGLLYIGLGDGGSRNDPERNALDLTTRLGKILRIDPRAAAGQPFTVPADNPLAGQDGVETTIWSYGLRNPWRFSFDPATGDLWIADVGQGEFEEIDHAVASDGVDAGKGLNFGWSAFEGFEPFNDDQPADGAVAPVYVYDHSGGRCSVSGGAVARDNPVPNLDGWYVFGDYCTGEIWAFDPASSADSPRVVPLGSLPGLAAISAGPAGELYAVSNAGAVARFTAG